MIQELPSNNEFSYNPELRLYINCIPFGKHPIHCLPGDQVNAFVSKDSFNRYGGLFVVKTPVEEYMSAVEEINSIDGSMVDLGDVPTAIRIDVSKAVVVLDPNTLYDFLYPRDVIIETVRLTTATSPVPRRITLDEVKLLISFISGISLEELRGIKAQALHPFLARRLMDDNFFDILRIGRTLIAVAETNIFLLGFFDAQNEDNRLLTRDEIISNLLTMKNQS